MTFPAKEDLQKQIIKMFIGMHDAMQLNVIAKNLDIPSDSPEHDLLKEVLNEMVQSKQMSKSSRRRYLMEYPEPDSSIVGELLFHNSNGYVLSEKFPDTKISIKQRYLNTGLPGASVKVEIISKNKSSKKKGAVDEILHRNHAELKGVIDLDGDYTFFIPDDKNYYVDFLIHPKKLMGAENGDKVVAKILFWDDPQKSPHAEIIEVVSKSDDLTEEFESVIEEFGLAVDFPSDVNAEAKKIEMPDVKDLLKHRSDLRKEDIVTIDPDDAKDFDDALSLKILENGNYYLGVHIADVSAFVTPKSALDKEALSRGNSTYLVDRVLPMLPEKLSNELCSLKPNRLRLTFTVFMEIDLEGELVDYSIEESIIKSKKRFTYREVQEILEGKKNKFSKLLNGLYELTQMLRKTRFQKGGVDFNTTEVKFILDENNKPVEAQIRESKDSNKLVEECMLAANKTVAEHIKNISKSKNIYPPLPFVYRVHDDPQADKLAEVFEFIRVFEPKIRLKGKSSKSINEMLRAFKDSPIRSAVNQLLLRTMSKAEYSATNIGHYGLGFKDYSHFTSPIRRYPDLLVHRMLKQYAKDIPPAKKIRVLSLQLEESAAHCTDRERVSMQAERTSIRIAQTVLANAYLGKVFEGTVTGVTDFGLFITMDEIHVEGLLHIKDISDDYYVFDEKYFRLRGRRNKRIFNFGDKVTVKIHHVNMDRRKIELKEVLKEDKD